MRANDWQTKSSHILREAGIESARLDTFVLLEDATKKTRTWLLAHPEFELTSSQQQLLDAALAQRATHKPLAYVRGTVEFYGRDFYVDEHVLVPRPESESIITALVNHRVSHDSKVTIMDVGTGSGALAVTAKLELPKATVIAIDIDPNCLRVAEQNAAKYEVPITALESDLLSKISTQNVTLSAPVILLCNLPYVPTNYPINTAAQHEPTLALYSGIDGLDHFRTLFEQITTLPTLPAVIITESLELQHANLTNIAARAGYQQVERIGLVQVFERR